MVKTMTKNKIIALSISAVIMLIALVTTIIILSINNATYYNQLEATYKRSFYELAQNINNVEVGLSKLVATTQSASQRELLLDMYSTSSSAIKSIAELPVTNEKVNNVNKYFNSLNGYSYSLLEKLSNSVELSEVDYNQISNLYNSAKLACYEINDYVNSTVSKNSIMSQIKYSDGDNSLWSGNLSNINNATVDIPSLIYDGPFSDSVINKEIKGLVGTTIDEETGRAILENKLSLFGNFTINYINDTNGRFATYNYNVEGENQKLYIQVTKIGGMIISINSLDSQTGNLYLSDDECITLASNFLKTLGYEDMQEVWLEKNANVMYINMAPVINNVTYYPDLIKVKVDLSNGVVMGLEATNYAYNHISRLGDITKSDIEKGKAYLSPLLVVNNTRYCVIPNSFVGESEAIEYECAWGDYTYFVYLSTSNYDELNILRVIETSSGALLQ